MGAFDRTSLNSLWICILGIMFLVFGAMGLSLLSDGLINLERGEPDLKELQLQIINRQSKIDKLSKQVDDLQKQYELNQAEATRRAALSSKRNVLNEELKRATLEVSALKKELPAEEAALSQIQDLFEKNRRTTRALLWVSGRGRTLENIPNPTGGVYENATISSIGEDGIIIQHRSGTARLSLREIPNALIEEFDLRP